MSGSLVAAVIAAFTLTTAAPAEAQRIVMVIDPPSVEINRF